MTKLLYKVSLPRADMTFHPSSFWHTVDWESSTPKQRDGYVRDDVLYVGDFDEVNIHLFPRFRSIRVRRLDADAAILRDIGLNCEDEKEDEKIAHIFVKQSRRKDIESFRPTLYTFDAGGFVNIRKGEYVSYQSQTAISSEVLSIPDAIQRWNISAHFVEDLDEVSDRLKRNNIYFDEQT
jgi:hypothetical protein